jgi:serine/threonine protein kinase
MENSLVEWTEHPNQLVKVKSCNLIGKGGFGKVYKHFYDLDGKVYAIKKILLTQQSANNALKEIRVLSGLNHIHIVRYFTSWIDSEVYSETRRVREEEVVDDEEVENDEDTVFIRDNRVFFLCIKMEYCESTLTQYFLNRKNLDLNPHFIPQILKGVRYLHSNAIIHRDLKPDNILITDKNVIKITDFGLAKTFKSRFPIKNNTTYAGTILYASPEQYNGESYERETDIFSLGIILFEFQHLFKTDMERIQAILALRNGYLGIGDFKDAPMILDMIKPQAQRPTIHRVISYFSIHGEDPVLWCRDLVWEILFRVFSHDNNNRRSDDTK